MEQGFKAACHQQDADIFHIGLFCCQCGTYLSARNHKYLGMISDQNIFFLLLPQDAEGSINLKIL